MRGLGRHKYGTASTRETGRLCLDLGFRCIMFVLHMPTLPNSPRTRSVRLDAEAERALDEIRRRTGDSITDALKRGLLAAERELRAAPAVRPYAVYERLDLGPGGYARGPSTEVGATVREILRKKHRR